MTKIEHLLTCLAEECNEVAQRCSKALRFGLNEIYREHPDGKDLTNQQRITCEMADLNAIKEMLYDEGVDVYGTDSHSQAKRQKVERFLEYSRECGTLTEPTPSESEDTTKFTQWFESNFPHSLNKRVRFVAHQAWLAGRPGAAQTVKEPTDTDTDIF